MKRLLLAAAVPLLLTTVTQPAASAATPTPCAAVAVPAPPGAKIESVQAAPQASSCLITVTLTHTGADHVKVAVALPDTGWNGRLQALGGSAYAAGNFDALPQAATRRGRTGLLTRPRSTEVPGPPSREYHVRGWTRRRPTRHALDRT